MAKVTLENGMVFEGTNDDLVELFTKLGAKIPAVETEESPKFEVGDYVKVLATDGRDDEITIGEIRVIVEDDKSDCPFYAETLDGANSNWFEAHELTLATDEEVAEAKRKQAEKVVAAKWASINRKPNEFKKGDIVRAERSMKDGEVVIGEICEIGRVEDRCDAVTSFKDGEYRAVYKSSLELITPVEARFDR